MLRNVIGCIGTTWVATFGIFVNYVNPAYKLGPLTRYRGTISSREGFKRLQTWLPCGWVIFNFAEFSPWTAKNTTSLAIHTGVHSASNNLASTSHLSEDHSLRFHIAMCTSSNVNCRKWNILLNVYIFFGGGVFKQMFAVSRISLFRLYEHALRYNEYTCCNLCLQ